MSTKKYPAVTGIPSLEKALKRVKAAQAEFSTYTQEQVDKIFLAAATAANKQRIPLAKLAVEETGMGEMADRGLTPIIASHNLRELEDICDHIGLIHQGGVILSEDISDMKIKMQKVQCVFASEEDEIKALDGLNILLHETRGRLHTITIRGEREEVESAFQRGNPIFFEVLALSLEEIFISETEVVGYDIRKFVLG